MYQDDSVKKKRTKPYIILSYEALFRELNEVYRQNEKLNREYANYLAGYRGEQTVDYKLSTYPQKDFFIYQGIRLKVNYNYFQIDNLILSRKFIINSEIKNIKGRLDYDSKSDQLTRSYEGKTEGFISPILQSNSQEIQFNAWLLQILSIHGVPIEANAIVSHPSTIINNIHDDPLFYDKMFHADKFIPQIRKIQKKYTKNILNWDTMNSIHEAILRCDSPLYINLIQNYNLNENHFINGIECKNCGYSPMLRILDNWECQRCFAKDKHAHVRKILDYFLLHESFITNRKCRDLLQIDSVKVAHLILKSMGLKETGKNKGKKYHAPDLEDYPQNSFIPNKKKQVMTL